MNVKLQKRFMNILVLEDLLKGRRVLSRVEKKPNYWVQVQNKNLKKMVEHIYDIPFYCAKFEEGGVKPEDICCGEDLLKLPVLTKEEYRKWLLEETSDKEKYKDWMNRKTTGSSGTPLELYSLPRDRAAEIANLFRCAVMQKKGYHVLADRVFSTMVPNPKPPKRFSIPYSRQMSSTASAKELVDEYNKVAPDFYYGNKTAVLLIAKYALDNNIALHQAKCVGSVSEALDDNARKCIEKAFGDDRLFDIYGAAECGNFAVEKVGEPGRHIVWSDTHVINIVNEKTDPDCSNKKTGQLAITSLIHYGFPLINYILGDTVEIEEKDGVKYITKILGRTNDVIKNRDGSSFQWMHINRIMFGITDITQFRVIQKTYEDLIFELASDANLQRQQEIESLIISRAKEFLGGDDPSIKKNIIFKWYKVIPPDPTGKVRILVSEVD